MATMQHTKSQQQQSTNFVKFTANIILMLVVYINAYDAVMEELSAGESWSKYK